MLFEGQFETDVDLMLHENVRECFRYFNLIVLNNNEDSLIGYSTQFI